MRSRFRVARSSSVVRAAGGAAVLATAAFGAANPSGLLAPNDECAAAFPVFDGLNAGLTNVGSTTSAGPVPACAALNSDVWFAYTATCTGAASFTTCPPGAGSLADTVVEVFDGTGGCGALVLAGCDDDTCGFRSTVTVPVSAGTLYYVRIGDFGTASIATGTFDLTITCLPPVTNDECAVATPIVTGLNAPGANLGATTSFAWPCAIGGTDVWYSYVATCTAPTTFSFCAPGSATYDSAIEVFDGSGGCGALLSLGCNDDFCGLSSSLTVPTVAGTLYYVRVGGFAAASGTFTLLVTTTGGAGSVGLNPTGCGGLTLTSTGSPTPGATVGFTLTGLTGVGSFIWLGASTGPGGIPLCPPAPCALGATLTFLLPGPAIAVPVPCDPGLVGGAISAQGGDILGAGGCGVLPFGFPFTVSGTLDLVIL